MRNFNGGLKIEDFGGGGTQKTTHKERYTENYNCDKAVSR